jgi:VanZ family protein
VVLLTLPGSDLPKISWFNAIHGDKLVHIGMFAFISFLWCWPFYKSNLTPKKQKTWFLLIAVLAFTYGIAMEFVQKFYVPGRSFEIDDMIADGAGSFIGYIAARIIFLKRDAAF